MSMYNDYGTLSSELLDDVRKAGFKPIGITVMMCEETFIFKGKKEANDAADMFMPEGWWYDFNSYIEAREQYVKENYGGSEESAPMVYWLDKNFAPKESE